MEQLPEIFSSLSVGFISLCLTFIILFIVCLPSSKLSSVLENVYEKTLGADNAGLAAFLIALCIPLIFGLGLLVQDYTDYLTDREHDSLSEERARNTCNLLDRDWLLLSKLSTLARNCLGGEGELRAKSLLKVGADVDEMRGKDFYTVDLNGVAKSLGAQNLLPSKFLYSNAEKQPNCYDVTGKLILLDKGYTHISARVHAECTLDDFEASVNKLYYKAKNWAYREVDAHFNELSNIQLRIDFSRSVYLSLIYGQYLIIAACIVRLLYVFAMRAELIESGIVEKQEISKNQIAKKYFAIICIVLLIIGLMVLTSHGYRNAEKIYNERVFGYFSSYCETSGADAKLCNLDVEPSSKDRKP